jgi:hypothetical protein
MGQAEEDIAAYGSADDDYAGELHRDRRDTRGAVDRTSAARVGDGRPKVCQVVSPAMSMRAATVWSMSARCGARL